jgi:hypothetical protein
MLIKRAFFKDHRKSEEHAVIIPNSLIRIQPYKEWQAVFNTPIRFFRGQLGKLP